MTDNRTAEQRSENMRRIKSTGMKPELTVRRLAHSLGYRYRLHQRDLPGKPDLVFVSRRKVIFVNGCFWHQHDDRACKIVSRPKSNTAYWNAKLDRNKARDAKNIRLLKAAGWSVLTLWECQVADADLLTLELKEFLGN